MELNIWNLPNFFFPLGAPKQFKMIVKLIRLYISLNVKNVKNLEAKREKEHEDTPFANCSMWSRGDKQFGKISIV